eukprot:CAMPEP_0198263166 /NCGR_PEP_ID=MMETSP1447-20131203/11567_1 /TAXON_ID=420782 /ORGANISM="Chaetoceros dichaeta, Strain CCMP1751" /LENGTH=59 /DNA_ID=CAMNT_0043951667 /DNA_START=111 /DNA_END=290 /DNA_ORIENTATION=-
MAISSSRLNPLEDDEVVFVGEVLVWLVSAVAASPSRSVVVDAFVVVVAVMAVVLSLTIK